MSGARVIVKEFSENVKEIVWGCTDCPETFSLFHSALGHCCSNHLGPKRKRSPRPDSDSGGIRLGGIEEGRKPTSQERREIRKQIESAKQLKLQKELEES